MQVKRPIPRTKEFDSTMSLVKEGFDFIPRRRQALGSDIFTTRFMGQKAVCIAGEEAAALFYDPKYFKRKGALPKPLKKTLLGEGGIHEQDGEEHHHRKLMFLSMMTPERLEDIKRMVIEELDAKVSEWQTKKQVRLFDEVEEILARAICHWAGLPLKESEVKQRTQELSAMVDSFGGSPKRFKEGAVARQSQEKWLEGIIKDIRSGIYNPPSYTAAYIVAHHKGTDGKYLPLHTAAVELNNAYRPMQATAYLIAFGALALHEYPETRAKLQAGQNNYSRMFAQEVRRFYPFTPAMGAKVKRDFVWHGYHFKKNMMVILDIFGTNRHPDSWTNADEFIPERFHDWKGSPFAFVQQGGGDHYMGHRCAGEWMTVMIMQAFFKYLTENISYTVPEQDLRYDMRRMPTLPKSRFIISNVKKVQPSPENIILYQQSQAAVTL
ncbi:cytochrome P450 [Planomicrobium sp. CPCC 101079]|uniref:cytochrome P450 n=1 Tax=Planomicrobium sp. CPCC 101079 TaxID=2599618 RepID=UPI0011B818C6|nr:cytochrome P450 [Planomicrobium sp. CPCC 101079]TWT02496.1 cytochrome P450 [Planomicrobium sp. CPCC 101079]